MVSCENACIKSPTRRQSASTKEASHPARKESIRLSKATIMLSKHHECPVSHMIICMILEQNSYSCTLSSRFSTLLILRTRSVVGHIFKGGETIEQQKKLDPTVRCASKCLTGLLATRTSYDTTGLVRHTPRYQKSIVTHSDGARRLYPRNIGARDERSSSYLIQVCLLL